MTPGLRAPPGVGGDTWRQAGECVKVKGQGGGGQHPPHLV